MIAIHDDLSRALERLEVLDQHGRTEFVMMMAQETNGHYISPDQNPTSTWDDGKYSIKAHGIQAVGDSEREAIRLWAEAAKRSVVMLADLVEAEHILNSDVPSSHPIKLAACQMIINEGRSDRDTIMLARAVLGSMAGAEVAA